MRRRSKVGGEKLKPRRPKMLTRRDASEGACPGEEANVARELHEARKQQMATAEILRVIRASPNDVQPVFETIVRNAVSLCGGLFANVFRFDGELLHYVASHNVGPSYADILRTKYPMRPNSSQVSGRVVLTKSVVWLEDALTDPEYDQQFPVAMGWRRLLGVPMLREGEPIGVIGVGWAETGPASKVQEELLKTFADQAAIAIENVRLFNEAKEALERQTATAEILGAISGSPTDTQPVFDAIVQSGLKLFPGAATTIVLPDGDQMRAVAIADKDSKREKAWRRRFPSVLDRTQMHGTAILDCKVIDFPDVEAHVTGPMAPGARNFLASGYRAITIMPMIRGKTAIGAISVVRVAPGPLSEKQRELLKTFAAQAVIAIENTRLLNELRESLQQQTATADVLKVISRSTFDLQTVLDTLLESAVRLCEARLGALFRLKDDLLHVAAHHNFDENQRKLLLSVFPMPVDRGSISGRAVLTGAAIQIPDILADNEYRIAATKEAGFRSLIGVPLLRNGQAIGSIVIYRMEAGLVTDKQLELIQTFADQAVIAIENTRLLNELRQRTNDLSESLEQQTATSDVLRVISSSPTNVQPVFDSIAESSVRLCDGQFSFVLRFDGTVMDFASCCGLSAEGLDAFHSILPMPASEDTAAGRAIVRRAVVEIPDVEADPSYGATGQGLAKAVNYRSIAAVPLLNEGNPIGAIAVARANAGSFPKRQIVLLQAFADQAVIAIKNVRLFDEVQARTRDLSESLEQQTATSEVLKVVSGSPGNLEPVFDAMLQNAVRICGAKFGNLMLREGDAFRLGSTHGAPQAYVDYLHSNRVFRTNPGLAQLVKTKEHYHLVDIAAAPTFGDELREATVHLAGARTLIGVPMLKDDKVIGAIIIYRQEVRPFTNKQIELVKNFAAQAVIAIENTRLLNELRESLQQQTATADVLKVISSSTGELQPVFKTMLAKAVERCEASFGAMWLVDGEGYRTAAMHGDLPQTYVEQWRSGTLHLPKTDIPMVRAIRSRKTVHTPDMRKEKAYLEGDPLAVSAADIGGIRTLVTVPMLKEGEAVGVITIYRREVLPFNQKQIELVENFAAQAVIAIENTRLLNELRQRTDDLTESLEQQTATSEVLKVMSSSPGELEPVFQAVLANATHICGAKFGVLYRCEKDTLRTVAIHGAPQPFIEARRRNPIIRPDPSTTLGRALATKQPVQIADIVNELQNIDAPAGATAAQLYKLAGARTTLAVPMRKDDELVGAIVIYRQEINPFTDKQIELVTNFAAQAVIAIENARLLNELRIRTRQLAQSVGELQALGEVSQAVNSTLDLETVLTTIVGRAVQLSRTDAGAIYVFDEKLKEFSLRATYGMSEAMIAAISEQHIGLGDRNNIAAATVQRKPIQVSDTRDEPHSAVNEIILHEGYRSILIIPLLRPDHIVGALVVRRKTPGEFPQSTIELLQTFADQSVVALQNARLYENVEARTRELATSLEDLRSTQDRLVQTQKLASLGQLTAGIAHEIKNPLNFVNNFSALSADLIDELRQALAGANLDNKLRTEITEIADTLQGNLDKVVQHGKRADTIVKNMLLHSREGSGEHRAVDINALVEEGLNLAYHGARAEKQGFNIKVEKSFDPNTGEADVFPQDITRVLLNLIANGFYAATKRSAETNGCNYEPTLAASTKSLGDSVEIRIRDNGAGIPPDVKEKMFNPFFTTKPAGEGTGLGLSISHDIIVKQHGGSIEVDTQPGEFTEIKIILPRAAVFLVESAGSA